MGIGKRIRQARENHGMTQKELAKQIGVTSSAIANYENEISHPKEPVLYSLLDVLQVDANFLFQDCVRVNPIHTFNTEDQNFIQRFHSLDAHGKIVVKTLLQLELDRCIKYDDWDGNTIEFERRIPLRISEQPASAGTGIYLGPEAFTEFRVQDNELTHQAAFGVPISGDSMEPRFHDGDVLLVNFQPAEVGDIALVTLDGLGYVKKIGDGVLISLNKKYPPIPMDDTFHINGKVIGTLSPDWM